MGDEYVQYAGIFARGVKAGWEEKTSFVWEARAGNWIYQEDTTGDV